MFVAVCDQNFGNSTSRCSKAGPSLPGISASRSSHSISSNGSRPGIVKKLRGVTLAVSSTTVFTYSSCGRRRVCLCLPLWSPCLLPAVLRHSEIFPRPALVALGADRDARRASDGTPARAPEGPAICMKSRGLIPTAVSAVLLRPGRGSAVSRPGGGTRRAAAGGEVAGRAGGEEQQRKAAEHEQRHRYRDGPRCRPGRPVRATGVSRLRVGRSTARRPVFVVVVCGVGACGVVSGAATPVSGRRRPGRACPVRALERAADVVLGVRVVADVRRQLLDRLVVAVEGDSCRRRGRRRTSRRSPARSTTRRAAATVAEEPCERARPRQGQGTASARPRRLMAAMRRSSRWSCCGAEPGCGGSMQSLPAA